jgi:predicted secreted hydrolase
LQLLQPTYNWEPARPDRALEFPRDHGAHRKAAYEWWYWTGFLSEKEKEFAGFQATIFRISPPAGPRPAHGRRPENASWIMVHAGFSDFTTGKMQHRSWSFQERIGVSKLDESQLMIDVPGLKASMPSADSFSLEFALPANPGSHPPPKLALKLTTQKPVVLHGENGFSQKGPCATCASHYSSFTRLAGNFQLAGMPSIYPATGTATSWFDHEFGSQTLDGDQTGWDWFSIQLDGPSEEFSEEFMIFQVRSSSQKPWRHATHVDARGRATSITGVELKPEGEWVSPASHGRYPQSWVLSIPVASSTSGSPGQIRELRVAPRFHAQEALSSHPAMPTYWEGACQVFDVQTGKRVGRAYLEMTGYAPGSRPGI